MIVHIQHKDDDHYSSNQVKLLCGSRPEIPKYSYQWDFTWLLNTGVYCAPKPPKPTCPACILLALAEPDTVRIYYGDE
jgi:hypothetical protein